MMKAHIHRRHSEARRSLEPGISRHTSKFWIDPLRGPSGTTAKSQPSLRDGKK